MIYDRFNQVGSAKSGVANLSENALRLGNQNFSISALMDFDFAISNHTRETSNQFVFTRFATGTSGNATSWNTDFSVANAAIFIDAPDTKSARAPISLKSNFINGNNLTAFYKHMDSTGFSFLLRGAADAKEYWTY